MQTQKSVRGMSKEELDRMKNDFSSHILPHLKGEDSEDYDLVWGWQRFVYEKEERIRASEEE